MPDNLTPEKAIAWRENRLNKKYQKEIADAFGVSRQTINSWIMDFDQWIKSTPEWNAEAKRIQRLLKKAGDCYERVLTDPGNRLGNPDVAIARDVYKMAGLLKEKAQVEHNIRQLDNEALEALEAKLIESAAGLLEPVDGTPAGEEASPDNGEVDGLPADDLTEQ